MPDETILNRRIKRGDDIVYPITRQENVINLQKTIKEKLPISSSNEPEEGTYVEKQVWLDTSEIQIEVPSRSFELVGNQSIQVPADLPPNEEITTPWELSK